MTGMLEPQAEALARQLHGLQERGGKVSDAALVSPMLTSLAISMKRLADHLCPPEDQRVGGFSQAEHNASDMLRDRFHDLAHALKADG